MTKRKNAASIKPFIEDGVQRDPLFPRPKKLFPVPSSPAVNALYRIIGVGGDLSKLTDKERTISKAETVEVLGKKGQRQVTVKSSTSTITVQFSDIDRMVGSNKTAKRLFIFTLKKLNEQAFSGGTLRQDHIVFPIKELIDEGLYSTQQSARTGFDRGMDILTSLKINGSLSKGKKNTVEQAAVEVLFTGANRDKGAATIFINDRIDWNFIACFYTVLPHYIFRLPNRAGDLLFYIFYLARQHTREIKERGYFTISLKAVQQRLNLPNEADTKNPERDIRRQIEDAIEAIENENNDIDFTITPIYEEGAPIADYLNNGYLKIGLAGEYAEDFIAIAKSTEKSIKAAEAKRERYTMAAVEAKAKAAADKEIGHET